MSTIRDQYPHLSGHILAVVDVETTDGEPLHIVRRERDGITSYEYEGGEVVQIAVQPINTEFEPFMTPFYVNVKPDFPNLVNWDAMRAHGIDMAELLATAPAREKSLQIFDRWFESLDLPKGRALIPIAHNWVFENKFLRFFMGPKRFASAFHFKPRDTMQMAMYLQDRAARLCYKQPFSSVGLSSLCKHFGIVNEHAHNALADCIAEAKLFKKLIELELTL
jgi:DNA polymerase III epsilon subunit-like protein